MPSVRDKRGSAAKVARAHMGSKNRVVHPSKPRTVTKTTQNSNLRLPATTAGYDS